MVEIRDAQRHNETAAELWILGKSTKHILDSLAARFLAYMVLQSFYQAPVKAKTYPFLIILSCITASKSHNRIEYRPSASNSNASNSW